MTIKRPPSPLTAPTYKTVPKGRTLHRVHQTAYRAAEFNPGLGGKTRFAPFDDPSGHPVPSLYAGSTLQAAIHETIFHDIPANAKLKTVPKQNVLLRTHSKIKTDRKLKLVELRNVTLGKWGISRRDLIASSPKLYAETVLWAAAIHNDFPTAEGLIWTSNQCDPDDAYLFFGDRVGEADFSLVASRDGATDKSLQRDVRKEGRRRGIILTV